MKAEDEREVKVQDIRPGTVLVWICWCGCADLCYQSVLAEGMVLTGKLWDAFSILFEIAVFLK